MALLKPKFPIERYGPGNVATPLSPIWLAYMLMGPNMITVITENKIVNT